MSGSKAGKPRTAQRAIDDIGMSHYSSRGGTTCSVNKRLVGCETCDLLATLREAQAHSAFWEHEYHLAKDSQGERDALQRRVTALEGTWDEARMVPRIFDVLRREVTHKGVDGREDFVAMQILAALRRGEEAR